MNENKIFNFIGNKWFILILTIGLFAALITTTYPNLLVVYKAQMMGKLWYVPTVFIVNILGIMIAIMKFIDKLREDKNKQETGEWE